MPLCIGIPKEIKPGEFRVAGLPEHVRRLRQMGCPVIVQKGAGAGGGWGDSEYLQAGAELADDLRGVYARADLLWKVKEILPEEFPLVRGCHTIYTYLHACPRPEMTRVLRDAGCVAIAYEEITDDQGRRPLLVPMSRLAGTGAILLAGQFCQSRYGGCGKSLFRTEGAEPLAVTILGAGTAGTAAAEAATSAGADVAILEAKESLLPNVQRAFPLARVLAWSAQALAELLPRTDVLVNCTFWMPGDPHLLTRDGLALLKRGSLIMDVAADPRGAIETSEVTTHEDPLRVVDGILHYCVQNIPSLFARTASQALAAVTWPYLESIAARGLAEAVRQCPLLRRGVVVWRGALVGQDLARTQNVATISPDELLGRLTA